MTQKVLFIGIVVFFATMNVLLWRVEFGESNRFGSPVPVESVVRRILTAPDDSSLEIRRDGERIGYCHWVAGAAEELILDTPEGMEGLPEGMVRRPQAYGVHLEGGILAGPIESRIRFSLEMKLSAAQEWQELELRLGTRPTEWELKASAVTRMMEVQQTTSGWKRSFGFDELRDPRQLAMELGGPAMAVILSPLLQGVMPAEAEVKRGLEWHARTDWMQMGGTRVQVFRLQAALSSRYQISVLVSRVGEIMRVELPGGLTLVNEVLVNF